MGNGADIVLLKRGDAVSSIVVEQLLEKGYKVQVLHELVQAQEALSRLTYALLIVDAGTKEETSYNYVKEFMTTTSLHRQPVIMVGKEVDSYESVLKRYVTSVATLNVPLTLSDLIRAVEYCNSLVVKSGSFTVKAEETSTSADRGSSVSSVLKKELEDIPEVIFSYFEKLSLFSTELGGKEYLARVTFDTLVEQGIVLPGSHIANKFAECIESAGKWGKGHLLRTAVLTAKLLKGLRLPQSIREEAEVAALLYALSFASTNKTLLRYDYSDARQIIARKDLCSKIKDSAMKVAVELQSPRTGSVISLVGKMIGKEENVDDSPSALAANTVMGADLIDRLCFSDGFWDPRAARQLLRRFRKGKTKEFHPSVIACVIKFLAEAISSHSSPLAPQKFRRAKDAPPLDQKPVESFERAVPLQALSPGMRLSRSLVTVDGVKLLEPDLLLDSDLIWRIWQLSAIRPISGPAIIFTKEAESAQ